MFFFNVFINLYVNVNVFVRALPKEEWGIHVTFTLPCDIWAQNVHFFYLINVNVFNTE